MRRCDNYYQNFSRPHPYKDFQGCTTHQAHSTDAHIREGHVWLAGKLKIVIVPRSESLPFASLKGVLAAKKIIILIISETTAAIRKTL
ncbi:MAG: hypothetical protein ACLQMU_02135 [Methanoregula sp.]|uniref:hypothetical protein n=1 Tax=Methanoregula sp. TaxID=2052170 RepID=UPI003FD6FE41